jgi:PAS domain S-box-containing protein
VKDHILRRVYGLFLVIFAILALIAAYALRSLNRSVASADQVNHAHAVNFAAEKTLTGLASAQGALRSFLLTGETRDRVEARDAFSLVEEHLETLKALTRLEADIQPLVEEIDTLARARIAAGARIEAARVAGQMTAVANLLEQDAGGIAMAELTRHVEQLVDRQSVLINERDTLAFVQAQTTRWVVGTGVAVNFVLFGVVAWIIRDDLQARRKLAEALQTSNDILEIKVNERTAELAATNTKLLAENRERRWSNQALEHQLRYNQLIVDSVHDLVFVMTRALKITRVNPATLRTTGRQPLELLGRHLGTTLRWSKTQPIDPAQPSDPLVVALRDGLELRSTPAELFTPDGRAIPVSLSCVPLRDRDRVVGGVITLQITAAPSAPGAA